MRNFMVGLVVCASVVVAGTSLAGATGNRGLLTILTLVALDLSDLFNRMVE